MSKNSDVDIFTTNNTVSDVVYTHVIRVTWKYYNRQETEVYLKSHTGFGALHIHDEENLHSHFVIMSKRDAKNTRNDINRYKTTWRPPVGFKALTIQQVKTDIGRCYRYIMTKDESRDQWINGMEIPDYIPIKIDQKKRNTKTVIEILVESEEIQKMKFVSYRGTVEAVVRWYLNRHKTIPMDGIFRQICKTVWMHLQPDDKHKDDVIERYVRNIINGDKELCFQVPEIWPYMDE